jgi:4-aminobutyrate aminotransferase-like enzyme
MKHSKGNFLVDTDGNTILDLINPQPLGYNNDHLVNMR